MKPLYLILLALAPVVMWAQTPGAVHAGSSDSHRRSPDSAEKHWNKWLSDLQTMGVETRNDSLIVRQEVMRLFTDSVYREEAYPKQYTWPRAIELMRQMDLKLAFWHLINLYGSDTANRSYVLGTFVAYDSLMSMDKMLLSAFYTYAFADPRVSRVRNNRPDIFRPDLLEEGLGRLKEIIAQVWYYREQRGKGGE